MYDGLDDDPESSANTGANTEEETVRSGTLAKLKREIGNLWRRAPAGIEPPAGLLKLSDVPDVVFARDLPAFRRRVQTLRHFVKSPADAPPVVEPPHEPAEPSKPVSTDPGESGKAPAAPVPPATPAGVDEREEMRKALRAFRRDAVLARVVAEARPFEPARVIEALDGITEIDDDGALSIVDSESGKRLTLDAATLRKLIPDAVPPPAGVTGGSGGKTPNLMPRSAAGRDLIERATRSQKFYDEHRGEVDAALRERQREGGQ